MIPFYKIFVISVRTFTKPAITIIKTASIKRHKSRFSRSLIFIGRKYSIFERNVQRRLLGLKEIKENEMNASEEKLLEKAATFLMEGVLVYGILFAIGMYELQRYSDSQKKEKQRIKDIKRKTSLLVEEFHSNEALISDLKEILILQQTLIEKLIEK